MTEWNTLQMQRAMLFTQTYIIMSPAGNNDAPLKEEYISRMDGWHS